MFDIGQRDWDKLFNQSSTYTVAQKTEIVPVVQFSDVARKG
jgi:hypothetical protein